MVIAFLPGSRLHQTHISESFKSSVHLVVALIAKKHKVLLVNANFRIAHILRCQVNLMMDLGTDFTTHLASSTN